MLAKADQTAGPNLLRDSMGTLGATKAKIFFLQNSIFLFYGQRRAFQLVLYKLKVKDIYLVLDLDIYINIY